VLSKNSSYLKPGIVTVFFMGVCFKKIHPSSAVAVLIISPLLSWAVEYSYDHYFSSIPLLRSYLGEHINFLHRVMIVFIGCIVIQSILSYGLHKKQPANIPVNDMDVMDSAKKMVLPILLFIGGHLFFGYLIYVGFTAASLCWPAALFTAALFAGLRFFSLRTKAEIQRQPFLYSTDFFTALLAGVTVWILYYFS
jgi:SSS family solute:Na+ symporter